MSKLINKHFFKLTILVLVFSLCVFPTFAKESNFDEEKASAKFIADVEEITGELTSEEKSIARFSFSNTFSNFGYSWIGDLDIDKASKELSEDEYVEAVEKAAKLTKNPASQGALKLGKAGQKILKALANTTEKVVEAGKKWVNENAEEYDDKKSDEQDKKDKKDKKDNKE